MFSKKPPNCLPTWLCHFAFPPAMNESLCCSTSLSALMLSVLDFSHCNRFVVVSHCFNLHFLDDMMWHIFSYAYFPSVILCWWGVCSGHVSPFLNLSVQLPWPMRLQRTFSGRQTVLPSVPKTHLNLLTQGEERAIGELPLYHHILRDTAGLVQEGGEG